MTFTYGSNNDNGFSDPGSGPPSASRCSAATDCLANPVIQEVGALPSGTSAPNTVITEHAMREFHIQATTTDWLVLGTQAFSASQIAARELAASTTQLSVESKNDQPTSFAVIGWATIFGIVIALGVLGMSVGLIRSETASDLRTLAATGASSYTRRTLTAVTAGALGFLGALLGTVGGYVGADRLAPRQLVERRHLLARKRPGRGSSLHSPRHASIRGARRLGSSPAESRLRWPTSRSSDRAHRGEDGAERLQLPVPVRHAIRSLGDRRYPRFGLRWRAGSWPHHCSSPPSRRSGQIGRGTTGVDTR